MTDSTTRPFAVVTGASTGIGYHLARTFAQNGFDVLITADENRIAEAAQEIETLGAKVYSVQADLAKDEEVERLWREVLATGRPVDAIALNAGVGTAGEFARETDLKTELRMIDLNVKSTVHLAKLAAKQMAGRRSGRILITASVAGTMPTPMHAVYGATKAFDLEFAQSLRYELKDSGVTVTALKPGATDTEFFRRGDMEDTKVASSAKEANDPAKVAQQGFDALMSGEQEVFAESLSTKMSGAMGRFVPDSVKAEQYKKMAKHGTADK
jgi:short-subunit dehydrogenase